jgi:hypothetical protein
MRFITEEPHIAGLPGSKRVAEYVLSKFQSFGLNAWIEETQALMPLPTERRLELTAPESYVARLEEPAIAEDKDSADPGQLPTYNAYAGEGDVEAQVVYANYGTPEDYKELDKMGIDVRPGADIEQAVGSLATKIASPAPTLTRGKRSPSAAAIKSEINICNCAKPIGRLSSTPSIMFCSAAACTSMPGTFGENGVTR